MFVALIQNGVCSVTILAQGFGGTPPPGLLQRSTPWSDSTVHPLVRCNGPPIGPLQQSTPWSVATVHRLVRCNGPPLASLRQATPWSVATVHPLVCCNGPPAGPLQRSNQPPNNQSTIADQPTNQPTNQRTNQPTTAAATTMRGQHARLPPPLTFLPSKIVEPVRSTCTENIRRAC